MPDRRLVDTSVLSLVLKRDTRAAAYLPHLTADFQGIEALLVISEAPDSP